MSILLDHAKKARAFAIVEDLLKEFVFPKVNLDQIPLIQAHFKTLHEDPRNMDFHVALEALPDGTTALLIRFQFQPTGLQ